MTVLSIPGPLRPLLRNRQVGRKKAENGAERIKERSGIHKGFRTSLFSERGAAAGSAACFLTR
uniref:Uncharacterized protein n=1 Tax=Siphoviridae sp. ctBLh2 TaxID=2827803 RepID=A0A8S5S472_9CAUD|nr:MAG TPA: hypothetical protein [Siphoviridae sp. ctBLh2]